MELIVVLSENGNVRKKKTKIKCDKCKERFEIDKNDYIKIESVVYCECPYCGQQIIINKR